MLIDMVNKKTVDNILDFWKEIEKGNRIDYRKAMTVESAMEIMKMIRKMPTRLETQILIDDIMCCVIRGISVELADELRGFIG